MSSCKCGKVEIPLGAASLGFGGEAVHSVAACTPWPEQMNHFPGTELTVKSAREGYVVIALTDRQIALQEGDTLTVYPTTYSITYGEH